MEGVVAIASHFRSISGRHSADMLITDGEVVATFSIMLCVTFKCVLRPAYVDMLICTKAWSKVRSEAANSELLFDEVSLGLHMPEIKVPEKWC